VRLAIAVALAFTVIAGGIALAVAVLILAFNLAWEGGAADRQRAVHRARPGQDVTSGDPQASGMTGQAYPGKGHLPGDS
jgi:hypothetical protein